MRFFAILLGLHHRYVFGEIAYNDSVRQCLTSNRGKTHEKNGEGVGVGGQLGPKLGFLPFSKVWVFSFPLNCIE